MPDGDKVNAHLAGGYQKIYKQLCESFLSEEELSHNILLPLKDDIKRLSNEEVFHLIESVAERMGQLIIDIRFGCEVNWDREAMLIEQHSRYLSLKKTAKNLLLEACKDELQDIKHGFTSHNLKVDLLKKFFFKIYTAKFEAKVFSAREYQDGASQASVRQRLSGMREGVWNGLLDYAKQAIQNHSFEKLRRPKTRRVKFNMSDLDEDLRTALR